MVILNVIMKVVWISVGLTLISTTIYWTKKCQAMYKNIGWFGQKEAE